MCVVDTKCVWWTQNLCGRHKICVGDTTSVWETQNLCGRHKHTLLVTRYTCLRVCWIPRAAPELWFLKDVLDEMTFLKDVLDEMAIPRKKTHYALDEMYVFEPKLFLKGSALVVLCSGARSKSRASRGKQLGLETQFMLRAKVA